MTNEHHEDDVTTTIPGAVITVSDRCSSGDAEDRSGPLAMAELEKFSVEVDRVVVVPDDVELIRAALQEAIDAGSRVIVTTGGTGITPRDVTPEASEPFISLPLDGLAQQVRLAGLEATPLATLSRGLIGATARGDGAALIVNAPGSPGGVKDAIGVVGPLVGHILGQLAGRAHEKAAAEGAGAEEASADE